MKNIISTIWKTATSQIIGIVAVEQEHSKKWRAYISVVPGVDEETDAQYIADWGAKLNKREAVAFFPYLDANKFDEEGLL